MRQRQSETRANDFLRERRLVHLLRGALNPFQRIAYSNAAFVHKG